MTAILQRNKANNLTSRVAQVKLPRSIFPMTKTRKQTMKAGYLYPIFYEEVLPSDTWIINMQAFARLATQLVAPMDNLVMKTYFFFDPHRLQWDNFPKQHGERKNPDDSIDYITPAITSEKGFEFKELFDYFGGLRCGIPNSKITAFAPRMYNRIFNAYFRSEQLQNSVPEYTDDQDHKDTEYKLLKKCKMHDYFTDCLPDTQLGEQVLLPLGQTAPVYGDTNKSLNLIEQIEGNAVYPLEGNPVTVDSNGKLTVSGLNGKTVTLSETYSSLYADLSNAVASSISAIRLAIDTQEILERDNRNGTRYTEQLEGRYGALNPDLRLTRPQYLGGTAKPIFTTPVIQTSGTNDDSQTPQGNIAGIGAVADGGQVVKASFGEFGAIMGLVCIQAVPQYQQGQHKKYDRWERYDYYYPEFNGLSDQAVKNKEIYVQGNTQDEEVFGYIGRYDEYRFFNNEICGELRSDYKQSLDIWHYAENFENLPKLGEDFIQDKTDLIVKRTVALQTITDNDNNNDNENGGDGGYTDQPTEEEAPSLFAMNDEDIDPVAPLSLETSTVDVLAEQFIAEFDFSGSVTRVMPSKAVPKTGGRIL